MKIAIVVVVLLLSGCATPGQSQLTPDQLKAIAADKNFTAVCSNIQGPWGTGRFVYSNVDRSVVVNGEISVDANCVVTMSNTVTPKVTTLVTTTNAPTSGPVLVPAPVKSP